MVFFCCTHESFIRAINFAAYGNGKKFFAELNHGNETAIVHLAAAANAGNILYWRLLERKIKRHYNCF